MRNDLYDLVIAPCPFTSIFSQGANATTDVEQQTTIQAAMNRTLSGGHGNGPRAGHQMRSGDEHLHETVVEQGQAFSSGMELGTIRGTVGLNSNRSAPQVL